MMKRILLIHTLVIFAVTVAVWMICFPETLVWAEGASFFSYAPDFTNLQMCLPADIFAYCGAFLLQFFKYRLVGALILALIIWIIAACFDIAIYRLTKRPWLAQLGILPAAAAFALLPGNLTLESPMIWVTVSVAVAAAAWLAGYIRPIRNLKRRGNPGWLAVTAIALAAMGAAAAISVSNKEARFNERLYKLEHLAEAKDWNCILEEVTPDESRIDPVSRRFALLALIGKGCLPDGMLYYGITSADDMIFANTEEGEPQFFNSLFYEELGADNEVLHQMYQISAYSRFGTSNRSLRRIVDVLIRQKNEKLVEKFLILMNSTPLHSGWVKDKLSEMEYEMMNIATPDPNDGKIPLRLKSPTPVLSDLSRMVDAYPGDKKKVDVLLSALLAARQLDKFMLVYEWAGLRVYPYGKNLPKVYQEAILLSESVLGKKTGMSPDPKIVKSFSEFTKSKENNDLAGAIVRNPGSYWAYYYQK